MKFLGNLFFRSVAPSIFLRFDEEKRSQLVYLFFCEGFAALRVSHSHGMQKSVYHEKSKESANYSLIYINFYAKLIQNTMI